MSQPQTLDDIIRTLGQDLAPVKPLRPPLVRAGLWIGIVILFGLALSMFANVDGMMHRLTASSDMSVAVFGSTLTAILGAIAVFHLSLPDRRAAWGLLPLPGLIVWIGASGFGCLRDWLIPGTHDASMAESRDCLVFILGISIPLSALMIVMIRRAFSLRPGLTATVAGLSCAAAAATLLNLFHPYDASATDLTVHLFAVALVVGLHRLLSRRVVGS